ncbi:hypothetical protein C7974DRAFT_227724 [Boeremia exigua]|uniref:uncharacterized protein n=1 Tax=Boeremia exigua TaxID=749465 RepID=UPI001E8CF0F8|nr:uncharacterized protein C7974DRAFT_227724 [Boeremia exigua]KAH6620194.1 hypothetical protein C7974DRAFT_227724 [Boeremia exigua]
MEPRIATLLDQSPYKRLTLDPSVLTSPSSIAPRYIEPAASGNAAHSNLDLHGLHDHVDTRTKTPSHAQSSAPLARVLNDPSSASRVVQSPSGRQTPQHASFRTRGEGSTLCLPAISPDAHRREEHASSVGYSGGDNSLIQLPKPPQVSRKTAKRPRIPPLLQGLHQPPPLPPKSRLFPPITSERNGLGGDVGDRFGLGNAFPTSSTEELAKARVSPQKGKDVDINNDERNKPNVSRQNVTVEQRPVSNSIAVLPSVAQSTNLAQNTAKAPRKRTRWSQKETDDLLTGVSRFGIGRWKQILDCTDFQFQGRTAVDLKDRFRVCRPGEGLKARKAATPEVPVLPKTTEASAPGIEVVATPTVEAVPQPIRSAARITLDGIEPTNKAATNNAEVHGPFLKSKRRARREFSNEDDRNLLKGFKRHGATWHKMRDDFELGFGVRHPTDLRDRFRIRYPELFAQAGYKLKPKEQRAVTNKAEETVQEAQVSNRPTTTPSQPLDTGDKLVTRTSTNTTAMAPPTTTPTAAPKPASTRPTFELLTDLTFDDDDDDPTPIILNRNILQWADENSTPTTTHPSHTPADPYNPFAPTDGLHINPLATLKLPSTAHWSYMLPSAAAAPSLPVPAPLKHSLPVSRSQPDMRTPNLPNIVFPYVPSASARNAVHNLPAPADILSSGGQGGDGYVWIG